MFLGVYIAIAGVLLLAVVYLLLRQRRRVDAAAQDVPPVPVSLADTTDAILLSSGYGRITYANEHARQWFGLNGGEPNLEVMAQRVRPPDTFRDLFAQPGQASFQLGTRRVAASSHFLPGDQARHIVVFLRDMAGTAAAEYTPQTAQALVTLGEVGRLVNGTDPLEDVLNDILSSLHNLIPFSAATISRWQPEQDDLRALAEQGDANLLRALKNVGGLYQQNGGYGGWVTGYRQSLLVEDVENSTAVDVGMAAPFRAYAGVPLLSGDDLFGVIQIVSLKPGMFDHEDLFLLETISDQIVALIERTALRDDQARRRRELEGIQAILQTAAQTTDRSTFFSQISTHMAQAVGVEMCGVLLHDPVGDRLLPQLPFYGIPDAVLVNYEIDLSGGMARRIWQRDDAWYSNWVRDETLVSEIGLYDYLEVAGIRSLALVPMMIGSRRIGMVQASNRRDGEPFTPEDIAQLRVFADQIAVVVDSLQVAEREARRRQEFDALQHIGQTIGTARDFEDVYSETVDYIAELLNVEMCGLLMYLVEQDALVAYPPFMGVDDALLQYMQIPVRPNSALERVWQRGEVWICNDPANDSLAAEAGIDQLTTWVGVEQMLFVPLLVGRRPIGAMLVANRQDGLGFDEENARLLRVFAAQMAVLLDNDHLQRAIRVRISESLLLRRVADSAASTLPLDDVIRRTLKAVADHFDSGIALVDFLDEQSGQIRVEPAHIHGVTIAEPLAIDAYGQGFEYSVVVSGEPFLSNDLVHDPRILVAYRAVIDRFGLHNVIMAPVQVGGQGIGELIVGNRADGEFGPNDLEVLRAVATQLGLAVERHRLRGITDEDLLRQISELEALGRVSNELIITVDLERVTAVIRQEALRVTGAPGCSVLILSPEDAWADLEQPEVMRRYGDLHDIDGPTPVEEAALINSEPVYVADYSRVAMTPAPETAASALACPVLYGERVVGVIHLYSGKVEAFSPTQQEFVHTLALRASTAYGNAVRFREQISHNKLLNRRVEQLNQIFELGQALRTQHRLEDILDAVAHAVAMSAGYSVVLISLLDETVDGFRRVAQAGIPLATFEEIRHKITPRADIEALFREEYQISSSYFLPAESEQEWRGALSDPEGTFHYHKEYHKPDDIHVWQPDDALLVPLRDSQGAVMGIMSVDAPVDGRRPIRTTVEPLEIFAHQASIGIENYRLLQQIRQEARSARYERDLLERLYTVSTEIQQAENVPDRLQVVANSIQAAGWGRVHITLRDENMEPTALITAGYEPEEEDALHRSMTSGAVWQERMADPSFFSLGLGSAYYLRYNAPWVVDHLRDGVPPTESVSADTWHPDDELYLPIFGAENRLIGLIGMDAPAGNAAPTADSLRPIELFAGQASTVIEMTRLYQETSSFAEQETLVNEIMQTITGTLDIDRIIRAVAEGFQRFMPFTQMMVGVYEEAESVFQAFEARFERTFEVVVQRGGRMAAAQTALAYIMEAGEGQVYFLDEVDELDFDDLHQCWENGASTLMIVPMRVGGNPIGVLRLGSELSHAFGFNEENLALVQRMANLAAVAIGNAHLYEQTAARERFSNALVRLNAELNATLDINTTLESICRESLDILGVEGAYIWQAGRDGLVGIAGVGPGAEAFSGMQLPLEDDRVLAVRAFHAAEPLYVNNAQEEENLRVVLADYLTAGAVMGVPLLREGEVLGVLSLVEISPDQPFSSVDVQRATIFATQASIALENARLYDGLASRAEQLTALTNVSSRLTATLEPDDVIALVLDELSEVVAYDGVTLWLREGDNLRIAAARGYAGTADSLVGLEVAIEDSALFQDIAQRLEVLNVPDVTEDARFVGAAERPTLSWLGAPLISKAEIIGLLALDKVEPDYYTASDEQLAQAFANQAVVALENARLFEETRSRTDDLTQQTARLGLLNRVSTKLAQSLDIENIFEVALQESAQAIGVGSARAILFQPEQQVGAVIVDYPRGDAPPTDVISLDDNPAVAHIRRTLQPLVVEDAPNNPILDVLRRELHDYDAQSVVLVPLSVGGQVIGLLSLESGAGALTISDAQLETLQTIATQAAIAVQNANLLEQSFLRTRELETLFEASQATSLTLDLDAAIETVAQQMLLALDADACAVMLWDEVAQNLVLRASISRDRDSAPPDEKGTLYALSDYPARDAVLRYRKVAMFRHDDEDIDPREHADMQDTGSTTRMLVPLVRRDQAIGLILVDIFGMYRSFGLSQQRIASTLAGQAAVSIENARLNSETAAQVQEGFLINELSRAISAAVDMEAMFAIVRTRITDLIHADRLFLALFDEEIGLLQFPVAVHHGDPFSFPEREVGSDEFSWIFQSGHSLLLVGDNLAEARASMGIDSALPDALSFLGVPLTLGDDVIGVLAVTDDDNRLAYGLNQQRVLTTIAGQIAIGVQNAQLIAQLREVNQELEARVAERTQAMRAERDRLDTLYNITAEVSATLDMDRVLERALDLLAGVVGADQGRIMLIDRQEDRLFTRAELGEERFGPSQRGGGLGKNEGLSGWIILNRQSVLIDDVQNDPRWLRATDQDQIPRATIGVLLETSDEVLGVLLLYSSEAGVFDEDHLRLVEAAASQLATSINNAELYRYISEQAQRLGDLLNEKNLEASKNKAILEGVADGVMVADASGQIIIFNDAAVNILEIPQDDLLGRPFRTMSGLFGSGGTRWLNAIQQWMDAPGESNQDVKSFSERIELEEKVIDVSLSPVYLSDQFVGTVSVFRDITREVEVDRMKTEFISNVSHELRTPMTSIKGYADLLVLGAAGDVSERQLGFLATIKSNADRLSNLVNDLLNISRLDSGRIEMEFQPVRLNKVADMALTNLHGRIENEGKQIEVIDAINEVPLTYGDPDKLTQIVTNLVDNAYQYTLEGGKITVSVEQEADDTLLLSVADTGIGIPEKHHSRVFDRFFRNDEHNLVIETPGTGLGLAIVKELVEMHGGRIWFESAENVGTTFYFSLPVYSESPAAAEEEA